MPHKSFTNPVEYLLEREFPAYRSITLAFAQPVSTHGPYDSKETWEWRHAMREKIEQRRGELKVLPVVERSKLVEAERAKELEEWKQKADLEERLRFFNQPQACADFDHWGKMAFWSLDEGIALCYGRDPRAVTWKNIAPLVQVSPFAKQFADAREIAMRAAGVNEIAQSNIPGPFIAWAKRVGLPFPVELEVKVAERGPIADWRTAYEQEHVAHAATIEQANARIAELEREAAEAKDAAAHRWPWGSYETERLRKLAAVVQRFWVNYDPAERDTAPTNEAIKSWLKTDQGVQSDNIAAAIATIVRADGLPSGRR